MIYITKKSQRYYKFHKLTFSQQKRDRNEILNLWFSKFFGIILFNSDLRIKQFQYDCLNFKNHLKKTLFLKIFEITEF